MTAPSQDEINAFVGAAHGDFETVKRLLAQHPSLLNASAAWTETAIEAATQTGRAEIVEFLLNAGAPLDICTAAMLGLQDRVEQMLRADPRQAEACGAHGIPLMYFAVIRGQAAIAAMLRVHGTLVNAGAGGTTPLHGAAMFNQAAMAEWLLAQGAEVNPPNYENKTPLQVALAANHAETAEVLRQHGGRGEV